jgi:hypothetical protein
MEYLIRRAVRKPRLCGHGVGAGWEHADVAEVASFHPASSDHRPQTRARMLYDDDGLYVSFHVRDRYVLARHTEPQSMVCRDCCVAAYPRPGAHGGYFNFETNCGGTMLAYYVTDPTRLPGGGLKEKRPVADELLARVRIEHSMPKRVAEELVEPLEWSLAFFIPNALFEEYVGPLAPLAERLWSGNFYKCADESSHPHWASWSPIGEALNFHVPEHFAPIRFA